MKRHYALLAPGEFAAGRTNQNYDEVSKRAGRLIRRGDKKLLLTTLILPYFEYLVFVMLGLFLGMRDIGFVWFSFVIIFAYLPAAVADVWVWRRVYGRLAEGIGYRASFLLNLDMLYWLGMGWLIGWLVL